MLTFPMNTRLNMKGQHVLYLIVILTSSVYATLTQPDDCNEVKNFYESKGFGGLISQKPADSEKLNVCSGVHTCCTPEAEARILPLSFSDIQESLSSRSRNMSMILENKQKKLDKLLLELIDYSKQSLHALFNDTYGALYTGNSDVFMTFFDGLKLYYQGKVDLNDVFDTLFTTLMQRVFIMLSQGYDINDDYTQCIDDNMYLIQPFSDLPEKLENQIQRSLVAAKTYLQGLSYGQKILKSAAKIYPTTSCVTEYAEMTHCAKCSGYVHKAPCQNICEKMWNNCLCDLHGSFKESWNEYVDWMNAVLERLVGPFDVEVALLPIDVKLSEAVMKLQDNRASIIDAVQRHCGPRPAASETGLSGANNGSFLDMYGGFDLSGLSNMNFDGLKQTLNSDLGTRNKRSAGKHEQKRKNKRRRKARRKKSRSEHRGGLGVSRFPVYSSEVSPHTRNMPQLQTLMSDLRPIQKDLKRFWDNSPEALCSNIIDSTSGECWNGHGTVDSIVSSDSDHEKKHCSIDGKNPVIQQQLIVLREMTSKLIQAHRGIDSAFPTDMEFPTEVEEYGSGDKDESETTNKHGVVADPSARDAVPKKPHHHPRKNGGKMSNSNKNKAIKHLEQEELLIIEQALGREADKEEYIKDIKEFLLKKHPHLHPSRNRKHGTHEKQKITGMTDDQVRQLRKILGLDHTTQNETGEKEGKVKGVTESSFTVKTTSKASGIYEFSHILLAVVLFFSSHSFSGE